MTDTTIPTVVVVDDSETSIAVYQFSLQPLAINFIGFKSAAEVFPYLRRNQPDLLFLDIIMPGMDGLNLLKELRQLEFQKDTKVIMVTSKDYAQDRQVARQLGAVDFLIKPVRFQKIREVVCKYLNIEEPVSK